MKRGEVHSRFSPYLVQWDGNNGAEVMSILAACMVYKGALKVDEDKRLRITVGATEISDGCAVGDWVVASPVYGSVWFSTDAEVHRDYTLREV